MSRIASPLARCLLLLPALQAFAAPAQAGGPSLRVREHFDLSRVLWEGAEDDTYFGLTNTVTAGWEERGRWALGVAFNPVLSGGYGQIGARDLRAPESLKLYHWGVEGRWHFLAKPDVEPPRWGGPFARAGVYTTWLQTEDAFGGDRWGGGYMLSIGWELPLFGGAIGVAPDLGFRHTIVEGGTQVFTFTPSVAASLYFVSDWLQERLPW